MAALREFVVLGFGSTHDALDAEALLTDLGIDVVPIPTPKAIGALCGIALRLPRDDEVRAQDFLRNARIKVSGRTEICDT